MVLVKKIIRTLAEDALDSVKGIVRIGLCCGQIEEDDSFDPELRQKHQGKAKLFYSVLGGLAGGYVARKLNWDFNERTFGLMMGGLTFGTVYAEFISPGIQLGVRDYVDKIRMKGRDS